MGTSVKRIYTSVFAREASLVVADSALWQYFFKRENAIVVEIKYVDGDLIITEHASLYSK